MKEKVDQYALLNNLIEKGIVQQDQKVVLNAEIQRGANLISYLPKGYGIDAWLIAELVSTQSHCQFKRWSLQDIDISLSNNLPLSQLKQFGCLPIQKNGATLVAITSTADSLELRTLLREYFPECLQLDLYYVPESFLEQGFGLIPKDPQAIFRHLEDIDAWVVGDIHSNDKMSTDAVLNIILNDASRKRASDIHFEPCAGTIRIRFRIDGSLRIYRHFSDRYWGYLAARLKVLCGMNTAESRRPQSGRFSQLLNGHEVDVRVASHPTTQGESMVLRLLDKHKMVVPLESLGFCDKAQTLLQKVYSFPHGLVLFTGPTGSGKTTTLYSILNKLNNGERNIMTLEDPVEYDLPGIRQSSVQKETLSFKEGIKAMLRQDPDIILIGEIRDEDTAKMAFRASQTGHLVFSTLHTNDVWGVFPRLMDLGISFESIKHTVAGIVSQRLVRKVCECNPTGCIKCDYTGYFGRMAIAEILAITPDLRHHLTAAHGANIPKEILNTTYLSLRASGDEAIQNQLTTDIEVNRYCGDV